MPKGIYKHKKLSKEHKAKISLALKGKLKGRILKEPLEIECPQCKKVFKIKRWDLNSKLRRKGYKIYCTRSCYIQSKIKLPRYFVCTTCGLNIPNYKGYKIRKFCSVQCHGKSQVGKRPKGDFTWSEEKRKKLSGPNSSNWKGGITSENKKIRQSQKFKDWRKAIFERDNYTCQNCYKRGVELHPDHILPFAYFPEVRFELFNGKTLCAQCHRKTITYGAKAKKLFVYLGVLDPKTNKVKPEFSFSNQNVPQTLKTEQ